MFVPDVYDQTDDRDDQAAKRRNLIRGQAEVDSASAAAVLRGGCGFGDLNTHDLLLGRQGLVASFNPSPELRIVSRAGQSAFTIVVDAGVDLLLIVNWRKHFKNHSSALQLTYAVEIPEEAERTATELDVSPEATVRLNQPSFELAAFIAGTALNATPAGRIL